MKKFSAIISAIILLSLIMMTACSTKSGDSNDSGEKTKVVIWGLNPTVPGGDKALVEEFNRTHPDIELVAETVPSSAGQSAIDNAKLMTAVAGGNPPDLALLDRFLVGSWALRGALEPLDSYLKGSTLNKDQFVPATWGEVVVDGKAYAIPHSPGAIGFWSLAYNKDLFVKSGIVDENGEAKPPKTWQEVLEYAKKLTVIKDGKYQQVGMRPLGGASFLYQWGWSNGAEYVHDNGHKVTLNTPEITTALEFLTELSDAQGGAKKISDFSQGFTGPGNDPFLMGKEGMQIIGEYMLPNFARYAPNLNFGVTHFPVPHEGDPTVTWGGGWSLVIPKGSKHAEAAWKVIEWIASEQGVLTYAKGQSKAAEADGGTYIPVIAALQSVNQKLKDDFFPIVQEKAPNVAKAYEFFVQAPDTYDKLYWRPHNPASDVLWQALIDAAQQATYHDKSIDKILTEQENKVQNAIDQFWSSQKK